MNTSGWALYEPMLERDAGRIRQEAAALCEREGLDALFGSVARFAVLAYAPSQHARHAFLAAAAAGDLRDALGDRFGDAVVECAIYAATSRLPWSEPPIVTQPDVGNGHAPSTEDAVSAVTAGDLPLLERWLAASLDRRDFSWEFFRIAASDDGDLGHKLIVACAAWRLAQRFPPAARFTTLRVALVEWCAHRGAPYEQEFEGDRGELLARLVDSFERAEDGVTAAHAVHLFDAALVAAREGAPPDAVSRVLGSLSVALRTWDGSSSAPGDELPPPVYSYARDLAGYLEASAIAERIAPAFGPGAAMRIRAAAWRNLMHGESFEEWSFA